jgi:hypothetical protein
MNNLQFEPQLLIAEYFSELLRLQLITSMFLQNLNQFG